MEKGIYEESYFSENYCHIIDSDLQVVKVKQNDIQELLDKKALKPIEIVGSEGITDLIDYLLVEHKLYNKYDIQYIIDYLNDIMCDFESEDE